jgi:4-amino-4-deoxy-L-arabinose transferase-like glycosyltransferase
MTRKSATIVEIAVLSAIWCATMAVVNPRGDFPLLDDWDFAIATRNFAQSGHFHFTQFTVVSLRAMVLWGAAWIRVFGDSFNVLRASTLTLSLGTILVVDRTLARARIARGARMLASLALLFNPIFLWTSCTYMTDVPYLFASAVAFYFFFRGLDEDRVVFIVAGVLAVMVSWFIRQNGLVNILPMMLMAAAKRRRSFVALGAFVIALYALLFVFKRDWLSGAPEMFAVHFHMWSESSFRLPEQIAVFTHYTLFNAQNSAVFFLPLTLPLLFAWRRLSRRETIGLVLLAVIVLWRVGDLAVNGYLFPYSTHTMYSDILPGNLVMDGGVGPPMLFDTFTLGYDYPFHIPRSARVALTIVSAILAISLLARLRPPPRAPVPEPVPAEVQSSLLLRLALALAAAGTLALFASG